MPRLRYMLPVFALYGRSRATGFVLSSIFIIEHVIMGSSFALVSNKVGFDERCVAIDVPLTVVGVGFVFPLACKRLR
jgi:succinate dehydrogenase/fumarate reductase cytochrome b subunit